MAVSRFRALFSPAAGNASRWATCSAHLENGMKKTMHSSRKSWLIIGFLLAGIVLALFAKILDTLDMYAVPYVSNPTPDILETDLSRALSSYEQSESSVIDLSAATSFSWDRLYVFGPYTPLEVLEAAVGRSWRNICFTHIDVLENDSLLVFTYEGKVVHCLEYSTEPYDFSSLEKYESGISIQDAFFLVNDTGNVVLAESK